MNVDNIAQDNNVIRAYFGALPDVNYYNEKQRLIRVLVDSKRPKRYIDLYLLNSMEYPDPLRHFAILFASDRVISTTKDTFMENDPRYELPPGVKDDSGELVDSIPFGFAFLIERNMKQSTTNYIGTESLNRDAKDPTNPRTMKYSISPPLNKSYTTKESDEQEGDPKNENFGLFVTENSVVLKGPGGGMLVLGEEGISLHGRIDYSKGGAGKGIMQDNPLAPWLPPAFLLAPLTIPEIPNTDKINAVGTALKHISEGVEALQALYNLPPPGKAGATPVSA